MTNELDFSLILKVDADSDEDETISRVELHSAAISSFEEAEISVRDLRVANAKRCLESVLDNSE